MSLKLPQYSIIRTNRKSMAIEIRRNGEILVRIPSRVSDAAAKEFLLQHRHQVLISLQNLQARPEPPMLSHQQIIALKQKAREMLPQKAAHYARLLQVVPKHVKITSAQKRFGSCSASKGVCFSYLLMQYPQAAIDYVVLHEIAHIVHHNHSKQFYDLIAQHMPDYKQRSALLKTLAPEDEV